MIVDLRQLPPDVQDRIPLSIRLAKDIYDLNELPIEIQLLIISNKEYLQRDTRSPSGVLDFKPQVSDGIHFDEIRDVKEYITEIFKNVIQIKKHSYPFDPDFYVDFRSLVGRLNTPHIQDIISSELGKLCTALTRDTGISVKVKDITSQDVKRGDGSVTKKITILLSIGDEDHEVNVNIVT